MLLRCSSDFFLSVKKLLFNPSVINLKRAWLALAGVAMPIRGGCGFGPGWNFGKVGLLFR
jgi:hypothetical protein